MSWDNLMTKMEWVPEMVGTEQGLGQFCKHCGRDLQKRSEQGGRESEEATLQED